MTQVALLRVGVDSGCGGIQGPLFDDGSFDFVCIPDGRAVSKHTYGNILGRDNEPHARYFPESWRMEKQHVHLDPEFETFTYGDPTTQKQSLQYLKPGDFLAFYCGLQAWDLENGFRDGPRPALYLIGYFKISRVVTARGHGRKSLLSDFGNNFHVRYPSAFEADQERLILIKGGKGSRLFRKAYKISSEGKNGLGKPLKVLSSEMRKWHFGSFGGRNSIERSPPRWIDDAFVCKAINFLKGCE